VLSIVQNGDNIEVVCFNLADQHNKVLASQTLKEPYSESFKFTARRINSEYVLLSSSLGTHYIYDLRNHLLSHVLSNKELFAISSLKFIAQSRDESFQFYTVKRLESESVSSLTLLKEQSNPIKRIHLLNCNTLLITY
jgi:hypothetical protein